VKCQECFSNIRAKKSPSL